MLKQTYTQQSLQIDSINLLLLLYVLYREKKNLFCFNIIIVKHQ